MIQTSALRNAWDTNPEILSETVTEFLEKMATPVFSPVDGATYLLFNKTERAEHKNAGKAWSPSRLKGGKDNEHVVDVGVLGFDVDKDEAGEDGISREDLDGLCAHLDAMNVSYAVHSTFRSGLFAPRHKVRVILPLSNAVTKEQFASLWRHYADALPVHVDQSCKNPERIFFLPRILADHGDHYFYRARTDRPLLLSTIKKNGGVSLFGGKDLNVIGGPAKTEEQWLEHVRTAELKDDARNQAAYAIAMQYTRRGVAVEVAHSEVWEKVRKALSENQVSDPVEDWEGAEAKTFRAVRRAYEKEEADRADNLKAAQEKAATIEVTDKLVDQARKELERGRREVKKDDKSVDLWGKKIGRFVPHVLAEDHVVSTLMQAWKENKSPNCMPQNEFSPRMQTALAVGMSAPAGFSDDWGKDLVRGKEGEPVACDENIFLLLKHHPETQGLLCYSVRHDAARITRVPPWDCEGEYPRSLADGDAYGIAVWAVKKLKIGSLGRARVLEAAYAIARENPVDEFRDYLDGLLWDGTHRLSSWLHDYLGAKSDEYTSVVGAKWLIGAVGRTYEEGAKMDNMLIFFGYQGKKKSMTFEKLLPLGNVLHEDNLPDIEDKDAHVSMSKSVICEMPELSNMSKKDINKVKHFITGRSGKIRPAYARSAVDYPRRGVLCGTTNEIDGFLNDPTGARRFWPVEVTRQADSLAVERVRDQLWAEAAARYKAARAADEDCVWWLTPEEEKLARVKQDAAGVEDPSAWEFQSYAEKFRAEFLGDATDLSAGNLNNAAGEQPKRMFVYPGQVVEGRLLYVTVLQVCEFLNLPKHEGRAQRRAVDLLRACKWKKMSRRMVAGMQISPWERDVNLE